MLSPGNLVTPRDEARVLPLIVAGSTASRGISRRVSQNFEFAVRAFSRAECKSPVMASQLQGEIATAGSLRSKLGRVCLVCWKGSSAAFWRSHSPENICPRILMTALPEVRSLLNIPESGFGFLSTCEYLGEHNGDE